jgi:hypothetical protein
MEGLLLGSGQSLKASKMRGTYELDLYGKSVVFTLVNFEIRFLIQYLYCVKFSSFPDSLEISK